MAYYVYLPASERNGTLYVGVSSHIIQRIGQHKAGLLPGFTRTHRVRDLVWYEVHESITAAIRREKRIKRWNRGWKIRLIEEANPYWRDLYEEICRQVTGSPRLRPSMKKPRIPGCVKTLAI